LHICIESDIFFYIMVLMARIKYKEAVGIKVKKGKQTKGKKPGKRTLKKLYVQDSKSIREIADILDCSKDMIYRAMKEYGIERRSNARKPKLNNYDLKYINETVSEKGYRKGAQELGVDKSTLFRYLKEKNK
jgi:transcriptional regulator with PAS, ATPase and Fis domain